MKRSYLLGALLLAAVGLVFWFWFARRFLLDSPYFLVSDHPDTVLRFALIVYGYITLVLGVFIGSSYRALKAIKASSVTTVKIGGLLRGVFSSVDFWLGLFASPIVYAILLQAVDLSDPTIARALAVTLVGLQNGFVCQTIVDGLTAGASPSLRGIAPTGT